MALIEALALVVVVLGLVAVAAPFSGIRRATRRFRTGERSTSAVILALINTGVPVLAAISGRLNPLVCACAAVLGATWLGAAIWANRRADRRQKIASVPMRP